MLNNNLFEITECIQQDINNNNKDVLIYAFNATGKTRLTGEFKTDINKDERIEALCYNSIVEDFFIWNNEEKILMLDKSAWMFKIIDEEELDYEISKVFSEFIDIKIDPNIDHKNGKIIFQLASGDDESNASIKISRGEETLFKWTIFYVILKRAIDLLLEKEEDRSTHIFNNLKYVVIDDPVSSLDDYKIYTISNHITELIKYIHEKNINIKFLVLTHHSLFFNLFSNALKNSKSLNCYVMLKNENGIILKNINNSHLVVQHITTLKKIKTQINDNLLEKSCFNMFRSVAEKTAVFLGYSSWGELFRDYGKNERKFIQIVNMGSHEKYSEIEMNILTDEQTQIFSDGFNWFINKYKFNI